MKGRSIPTQLPPWRDLLAHVDSEAWFPLCLNRSDGSHAATLDELRVEGIVVHVHDTIEAQVADLIRTRNPASNFTDAEMSDRIAAHCKGSAEDYGRWVFYPWSRRLVHLLPPAEFAEVRSDRNRNKITRAEQARLGKLKIALAGLSVGNAIANTLALEGVFGELRLADFDALDLSNMNRIRCAVHDIGVNKAVIAARQIFEQNPYANLILFTDGVTADNIGEFLDGADLVLDECDSMYIKLKLREEARARRIAVIMETSDRGMLDIERFDTEPHRPILHGLLGDLTAEEVLHMPPQARLGIILRIVGATTMSPRIAASLLELGRTLRGLSQLGSDVTLGGATTTAAVRRFGLGLPLDSGRIFVDVTAMLSDVHPPEIPADDAQGSGHRDTSLVRALVEAAVLAPSDGNRQPWRFTYRDQTLAVYQDIPRAGVKDDGFAQQMACIAVGAAIENIAITAHARGRTAEITLFPDARDPTHVASLRLTPRPAGIRVDPLLEQIGMRTTNRRLGTRTHLAPTHAQVLTAAARQGGATLQICSDRSMLAGLTGILCESERLRMLSPVLHADLMQTLRWTAAEVERTRDGVSLETYALGPMDAATLQLIRERQVAPLLRAVGGGGALGNGLAGAVASSAAVALLTVHGSDLPAFVRGGRTMQQVWLTATALGLALHPMNALISLLARVERYHGVGLDKQEMRAVIELREQFSRYFTVAISDAEILLFRLSQADPSPHRTLRRDISEVLTIT